MGIRQWLNERRAAAREREAKRRAEEMRLVQEQAERGREKIATLYRELWEMVFGYMSDPNKRLTSVEMGDIIDAVKMLIDNNRISDDQLAQIEAWCQPKIKERPLDDKMTALMSIVTTERQRRDNKAKGNDQSHHK